MFSFEKLIADVCTLYKGTKKKKIQVSENIIVLLCTNHSLTFE